MLSKKNTQEYMRKTERDHFEFTILKLSVGVVSVLLGFIFGTGMYANQGLVVHADVTSANTTTKTASTTTHTQQSYADKEYGSYGPTNSVPTTDATKKADVDGDNQITTIY